MMATERSHLNGEDEMKRFIGATTLLFLVSQLAVAADQPSPVNKRPDKPVATKIPGSVVKTGMKTVEGKANPEIVKGLRTQPQGKVTMEVLDITLDMSAVTATFGEMDEGTALKLLLEQNGIKVNGLRFDPAKFSQQLGTRGHGTCYHIVYPEAEKSHTHCE